MLLSERPAEPELEPVRIDAVEVVFAEALVPGESELLIQAKRAFIRDLRLEDHLVAAELVHAIDGHHGQG